MRVVLDTNALVSAALKQKSMPGMAALLIERRGGLLKSLATEQQLFEVVARRYFDGLIDPDTRAWLMIRRRLDLNAQLAAFLGRACGRSTRSCSSAHPAPSRIVQWRRSRPVGARLRRQSNGHLRGPKPLAAGSLLVALETAPLPPKTRAAGRA